MLKSVFFGCALICLSGHVFAQAPVTIFGNAAPVHASVNDPNAVTLGVKFFANVTGTISGIRFYRGHKNAAGYTVRLYNVAGTMLASAKVKADTCAVPCWESASFPAISLSANTTYIAAYYTSNGDYAGDNEGLVNGAGATPLFAQAASAAPTGNGVYTYSNGFPHLTYEDTNYWVDVQFTPNNPTLMLSEQPAAPSVPASSPIGTVVTTLTAIWSNGAPFTGTYGFAAPYSNDGGLFALSGNQVVVNASLPAGMSTQNITVEATQ
jgi:hypothetical protein